MRRAIIMAVMMLAFPVCGGWAEMVRLAEKGLPVATIVVPAGADGKIVVAARDLQRYIHAISGVTLALKTDGKKVVGPGLYIGQCEPTAEADLPGKDLNPETYAIHVRDGDVFFTGRWPSPTAFAVYSFIENSLGVRWFAPGVLWEYAPEGEMGALAVDVSDVVKAPDTSPRIWSGHHWTQEWTDWQMRNKTVQSEVVPRRQCQNFLHKIFPPERYGKTHPEYYPLINGQRYVPKPDERAWRPCTSNPDVLRLTVEYARKWFDENPNVDSFSLGMDDIYRLCGCPNCRAMDAHPDSYEKKQFSDRHFKFVNAVAREIRKTHPDRYLGLLIYHIARNLPETVPKLEDNVFGFMTERSMHWAYAPRRESDYRLAEEWRKRCKHLSRYDYYGMGTFVPRVYPHIMAEQVKRDKALGFEGMYTEVYAFLPHTAPMIWAFAKLQWDHTRDIDALLGEFYQKMYGPAAPVMKEYFDLLERAWNTLRPERPIRWVHRNIRQQALSMTPEEVDQGMALLDKAMAAAKTPAERARIEIHQAALRFAGYAVKAYACTREIDGIAVTDEASARRVLELAEKIAELARERDPFWAACMKRRDLLGDNLRGLYYRKKPYLRIDDVERLETGLSLGVLRGLAWFYANQPAKTPDVARRIQSKVGKKVGDALKQWLRIQELKPENLIRNGAFDGERAVDAGKPVAWETWSRTGEAEFGVAPVEGRGGSVAAVVRNAKNASYEQSHAVKPGERYFASCWTKYVSQGGDGYGELEFDFKDEAGEDVKAAGGVTEARSTVGDWQYLALPVVVPSQAARMRVMLRLYDRRQKDAALFDDVALYRVPAE